MQIDNKRQHKIPSEILTKPQLDKGKKALWAVFRLFLFIGLGYVILYPILYMVSTTFRSDADILDPSIVWIPKHFSMTNITQAFDVMDYPRALGTTLGINMVAACLQVLATSVVGYGFARYKFRGRNLLFGLVLFTIIVPPQTTMIPMFLKFSNFDILGIAGLIRNLAGIEGQINLTNTPLVMYLPALFGLGIRSGLFIYIFRQSFRGMPKELEEAALIDGCGAFKTFIRVMVPNAAAVYLTAMLLSLVWYWNDYYITSMLMDQTHTITIALSHLREGMWKFVSGKDLELTMLRMQAGCLLAILPPMIVYFFAQKKFTESVERSGIVG